MINNLMGTIGASELIITSRNTIYHLDISTEHLANTIILVGDPDRVKEVSMHFDRITHMAQHREFITHTGYIGSKHLTVISTGIGPDNIDIVLNEIDALANIDFRTRKVKDIKTSLSIYRLGTCGALQKDIPVDSLVVSSFGIGLDNLMHYYVVSNTADELFLLEKFCKHTGMGTRNIAPYISESAMALRKNFATGFIHGVTVTCPGFYGPQGRLLRAPIAFPNLLDSLATFTCQDNRIVNFEMETSAIYGLGKILGHKCLSISTVIANRTAKTFSKDHKAAVDHMIKHALETIVR